jgi:hypothetical protein
MSLVTKAPQNNGELQITWLIFISPWMPPLLWRLVVQLVGHRTLDQAVWGLIPDHVSKFRMLCQSSSRVIIWHCPLIRIQKYSLFNLILALSALAM